MLENNSLSSQANINHQQLNNLNPNQETAQTIMPTCILGTKQTPKMMKFQIIKNKTTMQVVFTYF